ncbi:MAG: peptide-methionine (S)-S-oxide reductase [Cytophagales bacterium]|nr:MAG: peptide-methionine (S)-S-oxide reductase [Cytophagales bacterium]
MKKNTIYPLLLVLWIAGSQSACAQQEKNNNNKEMNTNNNTKYEVVTFGAGCFWCVEAIFQQVDGVIKVESGYSGGSVANPTYKQVCEGTTGHAEVCQLTYDPAVVSFKELLEIFWQTHDPTTLNRQGNDEGTQYRSAIFYHNEEQKNLAEKYKKELDASGAFSDPIVTEIVPFEKFYVAENYHQNYFNQNGEQPYCSFVIKPKVDKFKKVFADKLKD